MSKTLDKAKLSWELRHSKQFKPSINWLYKIFVPNRKLRYELIRDSYLLGYMDGTDDERTD